MVSQKVVLAYSGGLDTSVAIRWLQEQYSMDVICLTLDLGQGGDLKATRDRALEIGATSGIIINAKELFVEYFVWPALQAGALYEGEYPLGTALGRPLIGWLLCQTAREEGGRAQSRMAAQEKATIK